MSHILKPAIVLVSIASLGLVFAEALRAAEPPKPHPYRLPSVSIKQPVIWGSTCEVPDGPSLAFGGEDQQADDGNPHTRVKVDGQWTSIYGELLERRRQHGSGHADAQREAV